MPPATPGRPGEQSLAVLGCPGQGGPHIWGRKVEGPKVRCDPIPVPLALRHHVNARPMQCPLIIVRETKDELALVSAFAEDFPPVAPEPLGVPL